MGADSRVVVVTGAARGIGFEIARTFADRGYMVVLCDLDEQEAVSAAAKVGHGSIGIRCDVTVEIDVVSVAERVKEAFGRIDVLINNAGLQHVSLIEDFPTEKFEYLLKVMLVGPFIMTKHILPVMKEQNFGRIINMASINGLVGFAGKSAYNSAKHGVIGLTKVTALEGAKFGITTNALCPGYVDTLLVRNQLKDIANTRKIPLEKVMEEVIYPLVPQKRLLDVGEIAEYALFLAGDAAKGITGQAVVIDGGYTAQ